MHEYFFSGPLLKIFLITIAIKKVISDFSQLWLDIYNFDILLLSNTTLQYKSRRTTKETPKPIKLHDKA